MAKRQPVKTKEPAARLSIGHRSEAKSVNASVDRRRWLDALATRLGLRSPRQEKRVAFVLGNSDYSGENYLDSPRADAAAIAQQLEALGFAATCETDLNRSETQQAIEDFLKTEVPKSDVALLYYSGHGVQIGGENYFVPVHEEIQGPGDLIHVDSIVQQLGNATKLTIVVLDACRSDPNALQSPAAAKGIKLTNIKGGAPGLAWMTAEKDVYIAYAAAPGAVALARDGHLSYFTDSLVRFLPTRGLQLDDLLRRVRDGVKAATKGKQVPWSNSAIGKEDFFFEPRSWWPFFFLAALGLASGIISSLAFAYINSNWSDYLPGFLLGAVLASALFQWGSPLKKCLAGCTFAALAWIMVVNAFASESTLGSGILFRSPGADPTVFVQPQAKSMQILPTLRQRPLSAYSLEQKLRSITGTEMWALPQYQSQLLQYTDEVRNLGAAYMDLFQTVKRMLFGILASVFVFCCFALPFPWLLRGQTIVLAAGAGAIASASLGAVALLVEPGSRLFGLIPWQRYLSAWVYQIPWQTGLAAVVGYALVNYVPDEPSPERPLFPVPYSWKPIALLSLGGALVGALASGLIAMTPEMSQFNQDLCLAIPSGLIIIAGFAVFARASLAKTLVFAIFVFIAWIAAYSIDLGPSSLAQLISMSVPLIFITLAGGALLSTQLRHPGVWLIALFATAITMVIFSLIREYADSNDILLCATLNLFAGAAIGYGLALPSPDVGHATLESRRENPAQHHA